MNDQLRYQKDKATVLTIIKYSLYLGIMVGALFFASKLLIVIMPFLLGFILAKASRHIANGLIRLQTFLKKSFNKTNANENQPFVMKKTAVNQESKKRSRFMTLLFPPKKKKSASKRTKISVVVFSILLATTLALLIFCTIALIAQVKNFASAAPRWVSQTNFVDTVLAWLNKFSIEQGGFLTPEMLVDISQYVTDLGATIKDNIPSFASNLLQFVLSTAENLPMVFFTVIVMIMSGFYFLTDSRMVFNFLSRNVKSRSFRHKSIQLVNRLSTMLFRVLGGYTAIFLITFLESLIIYLIAGIQYSVALALITAVLDFMPVLGVTATIIPLMIFKFVTGDYNAVLVLLIGLILISVLRRIIEPPILGTAMKMHPLTTLFAMICGVAIWGLIGFLLGPVVLLIFIEIFQTFSLDKKLRVWSGGLLNRFSNEEK